MIAIIALYCIVYKFYLIKLPNSNYNFISFDLFLFQCKTFCELWVIEPLSSQVTICMCIVDSKLVLINHNILILFDKLVPYWCLLDKETNSSTSTTYWLSNFSMMKSFLKSIQLVNRNWFISEQNCKRDLFTDVFGALTHTFVSIWMQYETEQITQRKCFFVNLKNYDNQ